jgi:hypothetical protein
VQCLTLGGLMLGQVATTWAAGGRQDSSGIVVWAFLGLCALIVVAQLAPAVLMLLGMIKGVTKTHDQREAEARADHR